MSIQQSVNSFWSIAAIAKGAREGLGGIRQEVSDTRRDIQASSEAATVASIAQQQGTPKSPVRDLPSSGSPFTLTSNVDRLRAAHPELRESERIGEFAARARIRERMGRALSEGELTPQQQRLAELLDPVALRERVQAGISASMRTRAGERPTAEQVEAYRKKKKELGIGGN